MPVTLTARNATLQATYKVLEDQHAHKLDVVAPSHSIRSRDGSILVAGLDPQMDEDGVTAVDGFYRATDVFDDGLSAKLKIPRDYLRRMRAEAPDLADANVNGWLQGCPDRERWPDQRKFLLRLFRGDTPGQYGIARAFLSNSYKVTMDHLDVLTAVLSGARDSGIEVSVGNCDLSERRLRVRIHAPGVYTDAETLLRNYRSPFDQGARRAGTMRTDFHGYIDPGDRPIVGLYFDLDNSETGAGKYWLRPGVMVLRCINGLIVEENGFSKVHLGARLADGVVDVSLDTVQKAAALVRAETRDAVKSWLNEGFLRKLVADLDKRAGVPIADAADVVNTVSAKMAFTVDEMGAVLDHFITGGQLTAGGIMQAVSSVAQTIEDPDRAFEVELKAVPAMDAAVAAAAGR